MERVPGPISKSRIRISLTPFVAPQFLKRSGRNTVEGRINAELRSGNFSSVTNVEVPPPTARIDGLDFTQLHHFRQVRRNGVSTATAGHRVRNPRHHVNVEAPCWDGIRGDRKMSRFLTDHATEKASSQEGDAVSQGKEQDAQNVTDPSSVKCRRDRSLQAGNFARSLAV